MKAFESVEDAYRALALEMASLAKKKLYRKENALDVVHDAFVKAQDYKNRNPKALLSAFLLNRELMRAVRRDNVSSKEIPYGIIEQNQQNESQSDD